MPKILINSKEDLYIKLRLLERKGIVKGEVWEKLHYEVFGYIPRTMPKPSATLFYLDYIYK